MTAVMLAIFVTMVSIAWGYPPQSRFLPLVIGVPGIVLTLVQLFRDIRERRPSRRSETSERREFVLFGFFVGLVAGVILFGFWLTVPVFLILFFRFHERENWTFVLTVATSACLVLHLIFDRLLEIGLHAGFITEYLKG